VNGIIINVTLFYVLFLILSSTISNIGIRNIQ
jgi:hypothetical protein